MSVLCAIPGLIWPTTGLSDALSRLDLPRDLPGLSALLRQATIRHEAPCSLDAWLCRDFGLNDPPYAALRLAGEQDDADDAVYVCADPVSLRFARQHLLLDGPEVLDLQAEEMAWLLRDLNLNFADIGRFHCTSLHHGYLKLDAAHDDKLAVTLTPLPDVMNRPVAQFQPRGEHAAWWSRLANELQVFCHNHAVNKARETRGAPALNSLWLWGVGRSPSGLAAPSSSMAAQLTRAHPVLAGLARLTHTDIAPVDMQHAANWMLIDMLYEPAQQRDAFLWGQALRALDAQVLAPLSRQLREGRITQLSIVSPGDTALTRFDVIAAPRWKFWQRNADKTQILAALSNPAAPIG